METECDESFEMVMSSDNESLEIAVMPVALVTQ